MTGALTASDRVGRVPDGADQPPEVLSDAKVGFKFLADTAERKDARGSLSSLQHVDELVTVGDHDVCAVGHDVTRCDVGVHVLTEVLEDVSELFKLYASVEQLLDRLEFQQVVVRVPASLAGPRRVGE